MKQVSTEPMLSTYLHSRGAKLGLPIGGTFELTARCNFRCPMCYIHSCSEKAGETKTELTAAQWIALAREARDMGMVFALLTGGEPFLRTDFFEIYHAMKAMGLMISINTNGSLMRGAVLEELLEDPPTRVNVSLYGASAETYRRMCGQDAFETVADNIRALKKAGVDVRINLSITPYNRNDISRIYEIARELDVHIKATSYMYPPIRVNGGQFGCGARLTPEEAAQCSVAWDKLRLSEDAFAERAKQMRALAKIENEICGADPEEGIACRAGSSSFWLTWDGRMLPCGMLPYPEAYPLRSGFEEAWQEIRKATKQIRMPRECGACEYRPVCAVCPAVCVTETGCFDKKPDYLCRMTEATVRLAEEACRIEAER